MTTYKELLAQRESLLPQIEAARRAEWDQELASVRDSVAAFGFTADDIFATGKRAKAAKHGQRQPLPPMFRDPESGETWSGRGRAPGWLEGKDRDKFRVTQ